MSEYWSGFATGAGGGLSAGLIVCLVIVLTFVVPRRPRPPAHIGAVDAPAAFDGFGTRRAG